MSGIIKIQSKTVTETAEYIFNFDDRGMESLMKEVILSRLREKGIVPPANTEGIRTEVDVNFRCSMDMLMDVSVRLRVIGTETTRMEEEL